MKRSSHDYIFPKLDFVEVRRTRYAELGYMHDGPALWRIIDMSTGKPIGPQYVGKSELLADLERFAAQFGC